MHTLRSDIVIAGGGFVGLAFALAMSRGFGGAIGVTVVDPGPLAVSPLGFGLAPIADARATALSAASKNLLVALGVWPTLADHAQVVTTIEITDSALSDGIRPVLLSYDPHGEDGAAGMTIVENGRLLQALLQSATFAPGVTLVPRTRVASVQVDANGCDVALSDGTSRRSSLVVAADGRASPLRVAAGIKTVGWPYAQTGLVAAVRFERDHEGRAVQHFLPGGPFAILPLPGQRACITWTEARDEAERLLAADDATFAAAIDLRCGGKLGRVTVDGPRQSWPLELQLARGLVADRLALLGDAARVVHPLAGQGLNLGLRDVAALAEVIADAARLGEDLGFAPVLQRYERWRRADGAMSAAAFDGLNRLFSNTNPLLRTARSAGLGMVDRMPALKRLLVGEASGLTGDAPRLLRGVAL